MRETVQYGLALDERCNRGAVLLLIEEEGGFLPVPDIDNVSDTVFSDGYVGVKFLGKKTAGAGKAFLFAYLGIASLINAADVDAILLQDLDKGSKKESLELFDSKGQRLDNKYILIFVNRESRKKVGFSEDDAAG